MSITIAIFFICNDYYLCLKLYELPMQFSWESLSELQPGKQQSL